MAKQVITWVSQGNSQRVVADPSSVFEVTDFEFTVPANATGEKCAFMGGAYGSGLDAFRRWELLDGTGGNVLAQRSSQSPSFRCVVGEGSRGFGWEVIGLQAGASYILRASPIVKRGESSVAMPATFYVDRNNANWR